MQRFADVIQRKWTSNIDRKYHVIGKMLLWLKDWKKLTVPYCSVDMGETTET